MLVEQKKLNSQKTCKSLFPFIAVFVERTTSIITYMFLQDVDEAKK